MLLTQLLIALPVNAVTNLRPICVYTIVQTFKKIINCMKDHNQVDKKPETDIGTIFRPISLHAYLNNKYY